MTVGSQSWNIQLSLNTSVAGFNQCWHGLIDVLTTVQWFCMFCQNLLIKCRVQGTNYRCDTARKKCTQPKLSHLKCFFNKIMSSLWLCFNFIYCVNLMTEEHSTYLELTSLYINLKTNKKPLLYGNCHTGTQSARHGDSVTGIVQPALRRNTEYEPQIFH